MTAVAELIDTLIAGGMGPAEAAALVARAGAEMSTPQASRGRSSGAVRMEDYRDRREAMGLPRVFPAKLYAEHLEHRDGQQCIYCRSTDRLVIDHIEPLFLGGNDDLGNLGFACRPCNGRKAGKSLQVAGMEIVVESAHTAHKSYQASKAGNPKIAHTTAHTSEHVRGPISLSSTKEDSSKEEKIRGSASRDRASRLSPDWQPTEADVAYAVGKGLSRERVPIVAEKFKNHWLSKGGKAATAINWHLKWCTWVMNELEWNGGSNGSRNAQNGNAARDDFRAAIGELKQFNRSQEADSPGSGAVVEFLPPARNR